MPVKPGDCIENPVTGERSIVLEAPPEGADGRMVVELLVTPEAAVVGEHLHPAIHESFEVLSGSIGYRLNGKEGSGGPGTTLEIPAGTWHDWWNTGGEPSVYRVTIDPAARFEQMIRTLFGLAQDGQVNAKGMPSPLQMAAIAAEFRDVFVLRKPPPALQRLLLGAAAPIARMRGYRGRYPRYESMTSPTTPAQSRAGEPVVTEFGAGVGPPGLR